MLIPKLINGNKTNVDEVDKSNLSLPDKFYGIPKILKRRNVG